jgi:hypothetical protein
MPAARRKPNREIEVKLRISSLAELLQKLRRLPARFYQEQVNPPF